jgi:hypothetical protein
MPRTVRRWLYSPHRFCLDFFQFGVEQPPGFPETLEAGSFPAAPRIEPQILVRRKCFDRENVPGVERHDIGNEAIDVVGGKEDRFALYSNVGMDGESAMALGGAGADLNAPEAASGDEDVVVAVTVSPGLGDAKTHADGFLHEGQFGHLSATFGRQRLVLIGGEASQTGVSLRLVHYLT